MTQAGLSTHITAKAGIEGMARALAVEGGALVKWPLFDAGAHREN